MGLVSVFFWPETPALLRNNLWLQPNAIIGHVKAGAANLISLCVHMYPHVSDCADPLCVYHGLVEFTKKKKKL